MSVAIVSDDAAGSHDRTWTDGDAAHDNHSGSEPCARSDIDRRDDPRPGSMVRIFDVMRRRHYHHAVAKGYPFLDDHLTRSLNETVVIEERSCTNGRCPVTDDLKTGPDEGGARSLYSEPSEEYRTEDIWKKRVSRRPQERSAKKAHPFIV